MASRFEACRKLPQLPWAKGAAGLVSAWVKKLDPNVPEFFVHSTYVMPSGIINADCILDWRCLEGFWLNLWHCSILVWRNGLSAPAKLDHWKPRNIRPAAWNRVFEGSLMFRAEQSVHRGT